jgi:hypothetical protein
MDTDQRKDRRLEVSDLRAILLMIHPHPFRRSVWLRSLAAGLALLALIAIEKLVGLIEWIVASE